MRVIKFSALVSLWIQTALYFIRCSPGGSPKDVSMWPGSVRSTLWMWMSRGWGVRPNALTTVLWTKTIHPTQEERAGELGENAHKPERQREEVYDVYYGAHKRLTQFLNHRGFPSAKGTRGSRTHRNRTLTRAPLVSHCDKKKTSALIT